MRSKILFIKPRSETGKAGLPIGLLYMSSYLKRFGYEVVVRDLNCREIEDTLWDSVAIVGISMLSYARREPYQLIKRIREEHSDIRIVVGGMHSTEMPKLLVDNLPIDAVVMGEGEVTIKELADLWIGRAGKLKDIRGIATRKYGIHKPRELIENLDDLPMPDYSQVNLDDYHCTMARDRPNEVVNGIRISEARYANMITSRGCMGRCKFCNAPKHWGYRVRFMSVGRVFDEIKCLYGMGVRVFNFNDDSFGQRQDFVVDLCKRIVKSGMRIAWYCDMRVDCVSENMLKWMRKSGCFAIAFGVESGSEKILKNIGKGITKNQIRDAVRMTKNAGIRAYALLMVGNMGETDGTVVETIDLMNEVKIDIYSTNGFVWVYPGTVYYDIMKKKNKINDEYWLEESDEMPILYDEFNQQDLERWERMLTSRVPRKW